MNRPCSEATRESKRSSARGEDHHGVRERGLINADPSSPTATLLPPGINDASRQPGRGGFVWLRVGFVVAALLLLFRFSLLRLWEKTNPFTGDPDWGHAAFIPLVGLA